MSNCARLNAMRNRSATCLNPISPSTAKRPRATTLARLHRRRASSRPRRYRTRPRGLRSWPTVLVAALATFALSSGFVLTGEMLAGGGAPSVPSLPTPALPMAPLAEGTPIEPRSVARVAPVAPPAPAAKPAAAPTPEESKVRSACRSMRLRGSRASLLSPGRATGAFRSSARGLILAPPWRRSRSRGRCSPAGARRARRSRTRSAQSVSDCERPERSRDRRSRSRHRVVRPDHHPRPLFAGATDYGGPGSERTGGDPRVRSGSRSRSKRSRAATITWSWMPAHCRPRRSTALRGSRRAVFWSPANSPPLRRVRRANN